MLRIAVTGGIAEGKSTVLGYLREMGFKTSSADEIARHVFDDPPVNDELARLLGEEPPLDRHALREAIFADPSIRRAVNGVMHPRITEALMGRQADFIEVPLLLESCIQGVFGGVWVVTCGLEEQRRRLLARYGSEANLAGMLGAQLPTRTKVAFADVVIRTNLSPESVFRNVSEALRNGIGLS